MEQTDVIQALAALAQPVRLQVFRALVVAGPEGLTPTLLAAGLDVSPSGLSFHLKELSHAGLVTTQRDGRHIVYRAEFAAMNQLLVFLSAECCQGEPCLDIQSTACVSC